MKTRPTQTHMERGVPVAKLTPVELLAKEKIFGCLAGRFETVGDIVSPALPAEAWQALK